jgi:hypothetical protein
MSNSLKLLKQTLLFACISLLFQADLLQAATPKYPFPFDFTLKAVTYKWEQMSLVGLNLINNSLTAFDSLEIRLYFSASEEDLEQKISNDDTLYLLATRLDLGILYSQDGYQTNITEDTLFRNTIARTQPQKIPGSYDSITGEFNWYFPVNLKSILFRSGARVRIDLIWDSRSSLPPYQDLMNTAPKYIPGGNDWSWGAKKRAQGYPADFNGIKEITKDTTDELTSLELNPYITVYRNGKLLWGLPPDWKNYYGEDFAPIAIPPQDPLPYAPIAIPFNEYEDQLIRDSANMKISRVRVNQAGYRVQDKKYFYYIANGDASNFKIIDKSGNPAGNGTLTSTGLITSGKLDIKASNDALTILEGDTRYTMSSPEISGTIYEGLLPELPIGKYRIVIGTDTSANFTIDTHLYNWVRDALLKFYGVNRCGNSHSWFHKPCHLQDPATGGWHDNGDHLKEGISMGHTAAVLGLTAAVFQDRDQDVYGKDQSKTLITDGIPDILYEARHGADFILQSYDKAGGQVADMVTSVGDFGSDHMWWGRPEYQDNVPASRGGPPRIARKERGANILGNYAANLAFVSKLIRTRDAAYSDRCLKAARDIYTYTSTHSDSVTSTPVYNGAGIVNDELAFGAMALLWATGERKYLDDLCFDKVIGVKARTDIPKVCFEGGWFANQDPTFNHGLANTDWSSVHVNVLWGFFRLVLMDEQLCTSLNLNDLQKKTLIEKTAYNLIGNLGNVGLGDQTIELPKHGIWIENDIKYQLPWMTMRTQMEWVWNSYQAGNITDMFCYYDVASKLQGVELPNTPASTNWKAEETKTILVRMLDYMLGVNPWDISMIYGVGSKNLNHPHHRASNPELRNFSAEYDYRHLAGALVGGYKPGSSNLYSDRAVDYMHSEVSLNSTTGIFLPVCGLSATDSYSSARFFSNGLKSNIDNYNFLITMQDRGKGFTIKAEKPVASVVIFNIAGQVMGRYSHWSRPQQTIALNPVKGVCFSRGVYLIHVNYADGGSRVQRVNTVWR